MSVLSSSVVRSASLLAALALLASRAALAAPGEREARDFAVRAGKVITIAGPELSPGVVIVRAGRIAAVGGGDTPIPANLPVVDAGHQVLMPGFIDAHSQRGLDRTSESMPNASFIRVTDGLNPVSIELDDARRNGITTLLVAPDDRSLFGGRAAIIHPQGIAVDSMIVKQDAALKISLLPSLDESRMGRLARLRQLLTDARAAKERRRQERPRAARPERQRAGSSAGRDVPRERGRDDIVDPEDVPMASLLDDKLPAIVTCPTAADVADALSLASEFGFHVIPVVAPEAWRAARLLRANGVRVIVTPSIQTWERLPDGTTMHVSLPKVLHDAGVPFALTTDPADVGSQHPWYQAALAVRAGVPRATALASVTQVPARLLGFGNRKGVIAEGADADFLLLSDDPLSGKAWVDEAYVRGARIYERASDSKLQRLLSRSTEPPVAAAQGPGARDENEGPGEGAPSEPTSPAGSPERELEGRWPVQQAPPR